MENKDKDHQIFNLQLAIQKLEEELALYRNGTTSEELLEFLKEKDSEIDFLKSSLNGKDETLRKIAKSSNDVLLKYDLIVGEKAGLSKENQELHSQLLTTKEGGAAVKAKFDQLNSTIATLKFSSNEKDAKIQQLEDKLTERSAISGCQNEDLIKKLDMVAEENKKLLADIKTIEELNTKSCSLITTLKDTIVDKDEKLESLQTYQSDCDETITKLHKRCAKLVAEKGKNAQDLDMERQEMIDQVIKFKENVGLNLGQRDDLLKKQDGLLNKLNEQLVASQEQLRLQQEMESAEDGDAHRMSVAAEKRMKAENEDLKDKVTDLEERLYQQEIEQKRDARKARVLRDTQAAIPSSNASIKAAPSSSSSSHVSKSVVYGATDNKPIKKSVHGHQLSMAVSNPSISESNASTLSTKHRSLPSKNQHSNAAVPVGAATGARSLTRFI